MVKLPILLREIVADCCENHTKHIKTFMLKQVVYIVATGLSRVNFAFRSPDPVEPKRTMTETVVAKL
jgi:hypothetical protein